MKICPKCQNEHSKSGRFCSRKCANSREWNDTDKLIKSIANKNQPSNKDRLKGDKYTEWCNRIREVKIKKYKETSFDNLGASNKRRRVFEEQNHTCVKCGLSEWLGNQITLELEHKDGNPNNNSRDNLEGLCPNCHSLTATWRGKNKPVKVTDDYLLDCLLKTKSIRQGLLLAGLTARGANYGRARNLLSL